MSTRVALVTGAASGMGRIFAARMAKRGVQVAGLDRDAQTLEAIARDCDGFHAYRCDVSDLASVEAVTARVIDDLGTIDRAVHCAAIMPTARLADQEAAQIHQLMGVNYGGTVNLTKTILPHMICRGKGELVLFGSIGGFVPVPECGAYCASKAAINSFAEVLIKELRGSGVRVVLVCPPLVDTPLLEQALATSNPKSIRDAIARRRFADPERMIDEVEAGLARGAEILLPGMEAKLLMWARRLVPRLLWKIILRSNRE